MSPGDPRHDTFDTDPYSACDGVLLISGDRDLVPAVRPRIAMVGQHRIERTTQGLPAEIHLQDPRLGHQEG
jgi:hypothetical protein